jgi:hypothetical protein
MSCIWSYVFCMQLFKQKGKGSNLSKYTTQYFFNRDYFKFDISNTISIFCRVEIVGKKEIIMLNLEK